MKHVLNEVCVRLFAALLLTLSILVQHGIAEQPDNKEQPMTQTDPRFYYLRIGVKYIPAVFEINGFPIKTNTDNTGFETTTYLNTWLKPIKNKITITLQEPSEEAYKLGAPSLKAHLSILTSEDRFPDYDNDPIFAHFEWPNEEEPTVYPKVFEFEFDQIQDAHTVRTNLWDEAEPIAELTDEDKLGIISAVQKIESAFMVEKTPEAIFKTLEYHFKDDALANGINFEELKEAVLEQYEWIMNLEGLVLRPLTIDNAKFMLVGENHLVKVERKHSEDTILIQEYRDEDSDEGRDINMTLYFAKINGEWMPVRG